MTVEVGAGGGAGGAGGAGLAGGTTTLAADVPSTAAATTGGAGMAAPPTTAGGAGTATGLDAPKDNGAEIYTYEAGWLLYAMNWSHRRDQMLRLAVGSFREETNNTVEVIKLDENTGSFRKTGSFAHPYPTTKIMFIPDRECTRPDLMATTADFLRLWQVNSDDSVSLKALLNSNSKSEFCAPLTSFDWNEIHPNLIGTSSIDTTCTIWDIETQQVDTQLIAHDKEVYDVAWGGPGVFASVSADGSVRVFDMRDKEHSTIIYETPGKPNETPLLRLGWNKVDPRYMATILLDSHKVMVLDIRYPTLPVAELTRHQACVNALAWAPHSSCHMCTAGDDAQALIWDLSGVQPESNAPGMESTKLGLDPILSYQAAAEINTLQWSAVQPDWVAIAYGSKVQILRV